MKNRAVLADAIGFIHECISAGCASTKTMFPGQRGTGHPPMVGGVGRHSEVKMRALRRIIGAVLMLVAAGSWGEGGVVDSKLKSDLEQVARRHVFFGHQSVGGQPHRRPR